jgi:gluconokinase
MAFVPGIRSPYIKVGRLVYFGRMMDKLRLHAVGELPADFQANLGDSKPLMFDARCCRFLGVSFAQLQEQARINKDDLSVLNWTHTHGIARSDEECEHWNAFMLKLGWRDSRSSILKTRILDFRLEGNPIETMFDFLDFDEGRNPNLSLAWELKNPSVVIIMGVAGCGKTTVGKALADILNWKFKDADEFHSDLNIKKMASGIALNEEDRVPWLKAIREHVNECLHNNTPYVLTCSALKQNYRDTLVPDKACVRLVYLKANSDLLRSRLKARQNHFMKESLLDSQIAALEEPQGIITLDAALPVDSNVATIRRQFGL